MRLSVNTRLLYIHLHVYMYDVLTCDATIILLLLYVIDWLMRKICSRCVSLARRRFFLTIFVSLTTFYAAIKKKDRIIKSTCSAISAQRGIYNPHTSVDWIMRNSVYKKYTHVYANGASEIFWITLIMSVARARARVNSHIIHKRAIFAFLEINLHSVFMKI